MASKIQTLLDRIENKGSYKSWDFPVLTCKVCYKLYYFVFYCCDKGYDQMWLEDRNQSFACTLPSLPSLFPNSFLVSHDAFVQIGYLRVSGLALYMI